MIQWWENRTDLRGTRETIVNGPNVMGPLPHAGLITPVEEPTAADTLTYLHRVHRRPVVTWQGSALFPAASLDINPGSIGGLSFAT